MISKIVVAIGALSWALIVGVAPTHAENGVVAEAMRLNPSEANPVSVDARTRVHLRTVVDAYMVLPVDQITPHPSAATFPGPVAASAPRISRSFQFLRNLPRWQSTGLYAAPGEKISIMIAPQDTKLGLNVVIGVHKDKLLLDQRDKLKRFPTISRTFALTAPRTIVANPFGGLIYIDVPRAPALGGRLFRTRGGYGWLDEHRDAVHGQIAVRIDGAVEAPLYRLGQTNADEWRRMRSLGTPWGEIASDKIIFSLPTTELAKLDDPAPLLNYWDKVIDLEAQLAGWERQPAPPERMTFDADIINGLLHAGYPVMAYLRIMRDFTDYQKLLSVGAWGGFHELGHNHEGVDYILKPEYTEVMVNLFSLYVANQLGLKDPHDSDRVIDNNYRAIVAGKVDFWTSLAIFQKPLHAFGWGPMRQTIASYAVAGATIGADTPAQKQDQWVLRYSIATQHNLAPYFDQFGIKSSAATRHRLAALLPWMPDAPPKPSGKP